MLGGQAVQNHVKAVQPGEEQLGRQAAQGGLAAKSAQHDAAKQDTWAGVNLRQNTHSWPGGGGSGEAAKGIRPGRPAAAQEDAGVAHRPTRTDALSWKSSYCRERGKGCVKRARSVRGLSPHPRLLWESLDRHACRDERWPRERRR